MLKKRIYSLLRGATAMSDKPGPRAFTLAEGAAHANLSAKSGRCAFTLAEVLITLGIIGIVAAMTIPTLIQTYTEKAVIAKAKKDYSIIMQALLLASNEYAMPNNNTPLFTSGSTSNEIMKEFSRFIPGGYLCLTSSKETKCSELRSYKIQFSAYKEKYTTLSYPSIILPDGGVIFLSKSDQNCVNTVTSGTSLDSDGNVLYNADGSVKKWTQTRNSCGNIYWDVNGTEKPNKFGYDAFGLGIWSTTVGTPYWKVYGTSSLYSILNGGDLIYVK